VAVLITETVPSSFDTYTLVPFGLTATPKGENPTGTWAIAVFVAVSITETLLLRWFVIYANGADPAIFISSTIMASEATVIEKIFSIFFICLPQ
jgi:hypothetical protein